MIVNEVRLNGRVYRYKVSRTKNDKLICNFGLQFWNGRDKDGNNKYAFVDCMGFEDYKLKDKSDVVVVGNLACDEWVDKNQNKQNRLKIMVKSVEANVMEKRDNFVADEIPWD